MAGRARVVEGVGAARGRAGAVVVAETGRGFVLVSLVETVVVVSIVSVVAVVAVVGVELVAVVVLVELEVDPVLAAPGETNTDKTSAATSRNRAAANRPHMLSHYPDCRRERRSNEPVRSVRGDWQPLRL